MQAVEHSPEFAAKVGIPQSVGQEFADADERVTASKGKKKKPAWHNKLAGDEAD